MYFPSNIIKYFIIPLADKTMHTSIKKYYNQILAMRKWSSSEIYEWQNRRLRELIDYAYKNTEYYKKLMDRIGMIPSDINSTEDLKYIPKLTKIILRENFSEFISKEISNIHHIKSYTGGSTGNPSPYYQSRNSWSFINANTWYNWEKMGYKYSEPFLALGSSSLYVNHKSSLKHLLYYKLKGKIAVNGINMSDSTCESYIQLIKKKKIRFLYGYASSLYLLAKYAIKNGLNVEIKCCFPTSEVLTKQYRDTIQNAFKCNIMDCYGANDGGVNAFSSILGFYEVGYNSIVKLSDNCNNTIGDALLTDLFNIATPLINYQVGDQIVIDQRTNASYVYNGQIINGILGRTSDIIILGNGRKLTGPGFTILFKDIPVEYYCIEKVSDYELICWLIKLDSFNDQHDKLILNTIGKQAGSDIKISIKEISMPFLSKSGKRIYFIDRNFND